MPSLSVTAPKEHKNKLLETTTDELITLTARDEPDHL